MSDNKVVQKGLRISVICYSYINHSYEEYYFKVKESTKMSRVMEAFAEKEMVDIDSLRFFFNQTQVKREDTPKTLDLKDQDQIGKYHFMPS